MAPSNKNENTKSIKRIRIWYGLLVIVLASFIIQLFYIQVIQYGHYKAAALSDQLKQYQIPAERGLIEANDNGNIIPIVLNQKLYTLYADPVYIKDPSNYASKIASIVGGNKNNYISLLKTKNTRYIVLARKLSQDTQNKLLALKLPGIGLQTQNYRVYPNGSLASQLLGFVNNDGVGKYGLEQALNKSLSGQAGQLKAITDAGGIPLAANRNNIEKQPTNGNNIVTTIDLSMQSQMEQILNQEYQKTKSQGISAVIMDANSGAIKAMGNYPSYDPSNYQNVSDSKLFNNNVVSNAIEPGSIMKVLTTAAALNQGVIQSDTSFYDPAHWLVDGFNITDIEEDGGPRQQTISDILNLSLNTGATWMLMQMGGGQINSKARDAWYDYMSNHYRLGQPTGIEQGYEAVAPVTLPQDNGAGIDLSYANTAFGQAIQITALEMAAADASVINGGNYFQPTLVEKYITSDGKTIINNPKILKSKVVSPNVSNQMISLMQYVVAKHLSAGFSYLNFDPGYIVGGKTGTAQIAQPGGGYYSNKYNGTYVGFVGGDKPQYMIVIYNLQPNVNGYAGSYGGQPVFADIAHMLINSSFVDRKTK